MKQIDNMRIPGELAVSKIYSKSEEAINSYRDLLQKARHMNMDAPSLTLPQMCAVASTYLERIGAKAPQGLFCGDGAQYTVSDNSGTLSVSFTADEIKRLRYGYVSETVSSPSEDIFEKTDISANGLTAKIEADAFAPIKSGKIFLTDKDNSIRPMPQSVTLDNGISASAVLLESSDFAGAICALIDSIFSLLARGADRRRIGLCIKYGLSLGRDDDLEGSLGRVVATILGAYRVMMELCIPDTRSDIILLDSAPECSMLCAAYTDIPLAPHREVPESTESLLYLLSFERDKNGMPSFASIRQMCDTLTDIMTVSGVLCVMSIDGSLEEKLSSVLDENYEIAFFGNSKDISAQGFIIQSSAPLKQKVIGKISKKETAETYEK